MTRVSKDSFFNFRPGREADLRQIRPWIGRVKIDETAIATCILVAARIVITPMHAVERVIDANRLNRIKIEFDDYVVEGGGDRKVVRLVKLDPNTPIIAQSPSSAFDRGYSSKPPTRGQLDYAALVLDRDFGAENLNDEKRGWLSLNETPDVEAGDEALLLSYPKARTLAESQGRFETSEVPDRVNHSCTSEKGSSGGLLLTFKDGEYVPVGIHVGGNRREDKQLFNFGVRLSEIREHLAEEAPDEFDESAATTPLHRLKIEIIAGRPDGKQEIETMVQKFFEDEDVAECFKSRGFRPWIKDRDATEVSDEDIVDLYQDPLNIHRLHSIAKCDIAFVLVSKKDGEHTETRDKLLATYGYLSARLGTRRVHLFHHRDVLLAQARISPNNEFYHAYRNTFLDAKRHAGSIADMTRNNLEDDVQGLFEVGRVVLPAIPDDNVFEARDFNAEHTLHILGFRFGRLKDELENILEVIANKSSRVVIAFPNHEVSSRNPYLQDLLQSGGDDTENFLLKTRELIESKRFKRKVLERVRYIAIDHIPTFVMTGADLWHTEGRMLISPAFPRGKNQPKLDNPRLLLHNKLSHHGVYNAYRSVLEQFMDNTDSPDQSWTLAEEEKLSEYIIDMQRAFGKRI